MSTSPTSKAPSAESKSNPHASLKESAQKMDIKPPEKVAQVVRTEQPVKEPIVEVSYPTDPTEQAFEQYKQVNEQHPEESPYVIKQAHSAKLADEVAQKSQTLTDIEAIMTDGLEVIYQSMEPMVQERFKKKGEEVAKAIEEMIVKLKFTVRKVLNLIREWLKLIPGINKYFLEQEAKIKADELLRYARKKHYEPPSS